MARGSRRGFLLIRSVHSTSLTVATDRPTMSTATGRVARAAWRARKASLFNAPPPVARRPLNLPQDIFPTKVNGKWRKPRISARYRARIRKEAQLMGTFGSYDAETGAHAGSAGVGSRALLLLLCA